MAEIPVVIKLLAERTSSVEGVLRSTQRGFDQLAGTVASIGTKAAVALGAMSASLVAVGAAVVRTAGEFESLQAKLTSALGSSEKAAAAFASTLRYAAETPFDVQGLVQATVTLEAFQQRSQEALPLAAALAAAFGQRVQDSALVVGKALSGSLEGFESLRNQYGITTVELKKFGAETLKQGGIALQTAGQIEKAKNALQQIVNLRYGDAVARQSQTLFGALSNLQDSFSRVAASLGAELIPAITVVARSLTSLVEAFERMPQGIRQTLVIGGTLAAALLGLGAVVVGLGTALVSSTATLVSFSAALFTTGGGAAGLTGTLAGAAVGFGTLGTAISGAAAASVAFVATPLGLTLLAIAGAAGAAWAAYQQLYGNAEAVNRAIAEQSRRNTQAAQDWRTYSAELERATGVGPGFLSTGKSLAQTADLVATALQSVSLVDFTRNVAAAGLSVEDLRKKMDEQRNAADSNRETVRVLSDALARLESVTLFGAEGGGFDPEEIRKIQALMGGAAFNADNLKEAIAQAMGVATSTTGKSILAFQGMIDKLQEANVAFDEAAGAAAVFGQYLQIASKTDDLATLNGLVADTAAKLSEVGAKLAGAGIATGNLAELQKRLLTAGEGEKKAILEYLKLLEQQEQLQNKVRSKREGELADQLRGIQEEAEERKQAGQEYLKFEQEKLAELAQAEGLSEGQRLQIVKEQGRLKREERQKEVGEARADLQQTVLDARASIEDVRDSGSATSREVATSITGVINGLKAWEQANAGVLKQSPELRSSFNSTLAGFEKDLKKANLGTLKEDFDELLRKSKEFGVEATTSTAKLAAVKQSLQLLETGNQNGLVKGLEQEQRYREEHNRLTHQKLQLEQQIAKEADADNKRTQALKLSLAEQELQLLEKRAAAGDQYAASQVAATKEDIFAARIQQIRDAEKAEVDAGNGSAEAIANAHERAQIKITQLQNEEISKRIDAQKKEGDAVDAEANRIQGIRDRLAGIQKNKGASPLLSLEEVGLQSSLQFADTGLGRLGKTGPVSVFGRQDQTLAQIRAQVQNESVLAERGASRRASGFDQGLAKTPQTGAGGTVVNNYNTNNLSLPQLRGTDVERQAENLGSTVSRAVDKKRLISGGGGGGLSS